MRANSKDRINGASARTGKRKCNGRKSATAEPRRKNGSAAKPNGMALIGSEAGNGSLADSYTIEDAPAHPLNGLAERSKDKPGIPFKPDVIKALAELRKGDRAAYENTIGRLKAAGVRTSELETCIRALAGEAVSDPTQSDLLIQFGTEGGLFHTSDGTCFADVIVNDHRETWPVRGNGFKRWLSWRFFQQRKAAPDKEAVEKALALIEAQAYHDGPEQEVHQRVALA
jgi:hypothetical protein